MAVFEDRILADPTAEEEELASSVISVALDPSSGVLCQLQKVEKQSVPLLNYSTFLASPDSGRRGARVERETARVYGPGQEAGEADREDGRGRRSSQDLSTVRHDKIPDRFILLVAKIQLKLFTRKS